jgi:predicted transcriptional regulator
MSQLVQDDPKTQFVGTHVDEPTHAELLALARREDRSLSSVVRRALREYLTRDDETGDKT